MPAKKAAPAKQEKSRSPSHSSSSSSSASSAPVAAVKVAAAAAAATTHEEKYVPPQYSILFEYVFNPFYVFVATFYPSWWSPNGITLFGITCTVLASVIFFTDAINPVTNDPATGLPRTAAGFDVLYELRPTSLRSYEAAHGRKFNSTSTSDLISVPAAFVSDREYDAGSFVDVNSGNSWAFIICGLLNWIYIIADNTDGKQARRYKMSSLIGEYLDHGLDSVTALLSCFMIGAAAGERIALGFLLQVGCSIMMVCSHFHHLDTNVFIWGDRLFSVDEAMVLIASYPLLVGLFHSTQSAFLAFTAIRFVQLVVVLFAAGVGTNIVKFIWLNPRIVNPKVNPLFLIELALLGAMTFWSVFHKGGMSNSVTAENQKILSILSPYLNWQDTDHFSFPSGNKPGDGAAADTMPAAVRALYQGVVLLCPPYLLRVVGSRVLKLLVTYPACWAITHACVTSTLVHIPISTKCLKERKMTNYLPLAGCFLAVWAFGVSPASGMVISVLWHLGQIVINCVKLQTKRH